MNKKTKNKKQTFHKHDSLQQIWSRLGGVDPRSGRQPSMETCKTASKSINSENALELLAGERC